VGGDGGTMEKKGEGEDAPTDIPAYGRWAPLASQMSGGKGEAAGVVGL